MFIILTAMEDTLTLKREGAKVQRSTPSSKRWVMIKDAIDKASGNGRCWWIEQYLRKTLK